MLILTMKPQEIKPQEQTDWLGFCKDVSQSSSSLTIRA